jgi:hypothetical protein
MINADNSNEEPNPKKAQMMYNTMDPFCNLKNKYSHVRVDANKDEEVSHEDDLEFLLRGLKNSYSHQPIFLQAVEEMAISLKPLFADPLNGLFYKKVFLMMAEPERVISFHVKWEDDKGKLHQNRGWRVEFSRYGKLWIVVNFLSYRSSSPTNVYTYIHIYIYIYLCYLVLMI